MKKGMEFTMSTIIVIIILLVTALFILQFLAAGFPAATKPLSGIIGEVKDETGGKLVGCGNNIRESYLGEKCDGTDFGPDCAVGATVCTDCKTC
ncbi:MAG: hypothetical protein ABH829_03940 [archaeon]